MAPLAIALSSPLWVQLARDLASATEQHWPGPHTHRLNNYAFQECPTAEFLIAADRAGFLYVGCGNFTAVFSHPSTPELVYKLNAGSDDDMEMYHRWLMTQTHKNLPRVYHVESYGRGCVAISEELRPTDGYISGYSEEMVEIMGELRPMIEGAGFACNDLHGGNIMMRGSTLVLNDPCSDGYSD